MAPSGLGGLFKSGGVAEQFAVWNVAAAFVNAALEPELELLSREVNKALPSTPLTAAQLADMVVRNIVEHATAESYARESGIAPVDFTRMVQSAGEAPSPQELLMAHRRGLIPIDGTGPDAVSVRQGIAEGRTYNKYFAMLAGLAEVPLSVADAVDAVVESQIDYAAGEHIAYVNGISAADFKILVDTRGNPPSPSELNVLLRRKLIPLEGTGPDVLSVQQGIAEGATKNKWWRMLASLSDYIPPPRTVTAMVREGSLTDAQALVFYEASGLGEELAAAYLTSAHHQKTQTHRDLALSQILTLYKDRIIDAAAARAFMTALRWNDTDQTFLLDLADFEVEQTRTRTAIAKVHSLYVAHKIDATIATTTLDGLGVPPAGRDSMLSTWNLERAANTPTLTRAEIVDAVFFGIIDIPTGIERLGQLGWSAEDAFILISIRFKGQPPLPKPA